MPWYKLPHADLVMHFDQEMDLEPADEQTGTADALDAIESIHEANREGTVSLPELRKQLGQEAEAT